MAGLVARLGAQDSGREAAQVPGQLGLVQLLERPGDDVADEDAGGELDDGGRARDVARVKMSTSTPRRASRLATSTM
ncbi:Uncharacterised protein [Actinomadura madurae]|nr:Uncharacterised protein [Actinomadura madurae]